MFEMLINIYNLGGSETSSKHVFNESYFVGIVKHTQTLCKAVIADLLPKEKHAKVYGTSSALGSLGFVVGPVIGGHLSELNYGFSYASMLTGLIFLVNAGEHSII